MIRRFRRESERRADRGLDEAVACYRARARGEQLSEAARGRILRETIEAQETQPLPTRLRSAAWRVLAGALPIAAFGLLVLVMADRSGTVGGRAMRIRATKAGGEVIFSIANGSSNHKVYKSSVPNGFVASERMAVHAGSFRDTVDDGSGLVFYRID